MRQICEQMAEKTASSICTAIFRPFSARDRTRRASWDCNMQNYCGCVFSEEDRYRKRKKKKQPADAQA